MGEKVETDAGKSITVPQGGAAKYAPYRLFFTLNVDEDGRFPEIDGLATDFTPVAVGSSMVTTKKPSRLSRSLQRAAVWRARISEIWGAR
jgi:hypothetical protein